MLSRTKRYFYEGKVMTEFDLESHMRVLTVGGTHSNLARQAMRKRLDDLEAEVVAATGKRNAALEALSEEVGRSVRAEAEIARLKEQFLELSKQHIILESEAREKVLSTKIGTLREAASIVGGMEDLANAAAHLESIADKLVQQ